MTEYQKLNSDDKTSSIFSNEDIPLGNNKIFFQNSKSTTKKDTDNLDIMEVNDLSASFKKKLNDILSLSINTDSISHYNKSRTGNMLIVLYNKENEPLIVLGPDWILNLFITIIIFLLVFIFFHHFQNAMSDSFHFYGTLLCFITLVAYIICFVKDPGIVPKDLWIENYFKNKSNSNNNEQTFSQKICRECKIIMKSNEQIEHCKKCNICVAGKKKHSILIGKCIGAKNKYYYFSYIFFCCSLGIYLLFSFVEILFNKKKE